MTNPSNVQVFKIDKIEAFNNIISELSSQVQYDPQLRPHPWTTSHRIRRKLKSKDIRAIIVIAYCAELNRQALAFDEEQQREPGTTYETNYPEYFLTTQEIDVIVEYLRALCFAVGENGFYDTVIDKTEQERICRR